MVVLLVDDEKTCLLDVSESLTPTGWDIIATTSPLEAFEIYKSNKIDVVISDIRMPEMNGIQLLKLIKDYDKNSRVIIITAYGDLDTAKNAINNHAYAFFGKPINFSDLISTLQVIEKEISENNELSVDFVKLKEEHTNLKSAYKDLLKLIKDI